MTTVDVHAHLVPDAAFSRLPAGLRAEADRERDEIALWSEDRGKVGRGAPRDLRELALHREVQARRKVDLSLIGPWIDMVKAPLDPATQQRFCRVLNEELAAATAGTSHSRFLAALPDLDGGAAAEELARAVEDGAAGGMVSANPEVGSLGRPDFDRLWETAEQLRAPLVIHPGEFEPPERLRQFFLVNLVGNPFETTLAVGHLLGVNVPARFPDLRLVLVHGGGFFPYQYGRLTAGFARWPGLKGQNRRPPKDYLRWFYYDTVLFDDEPTRYLLDLVGPDRVLAGSDCPFTMADHRPFEVPDSLGLEPAATESVLGANALRVFSLRDSATGGPAPADLEQVAATHEA